MTETVPTEPLARNELARQLLPMTRRKVVGYIRRYPRVDPHDFESAAGQAVAEALDTFDPGRGVSLRQHVAVQLRGRLKDVVAAATGIRNDRPRGQLLPFPTKPSGEVIEFADDRACDPAAVAAVADGWPDPHEVARQAARLKAAVVASLTPADVQAVMRAVVEKAKNGHLPAAKVVLAVAGA